MHTLELINFIISIVFFICYLYQFAYIPVPIIKKPVPLAEGAANNYAVLICARNEENVIADLIESIRTQTYEKGRVTVFVMADNCTDSTAQVARDAGAVVYERFNKALVGKGYALDALLKYISAYYPNGFDGYFVFDADNILEPDYIERMNETFSSGFDIVTSYRNSKNYGDNWITAGYGLWFLRESKYLNGARSILGTSCAVSGTGFMFSRKLLSEVGGWPFHLLTEDIEFSVYNILKGYKIGYCAGAMFYDEQPASFSQSWRQRMRWSKGYLQVFRKHGAELISGAIKGRFACFDMSMSIMPAIILTAFGIVTNIIIAVMGIMNGNDILPSLRSSIIMLSGMYLTLFFVGSISTITEWKRIHTSTAKKILYAFTFPLFMFTYIPISICALFTRVEWKPIEHHVSATAIRAQSRL